MKQLFQKISVLTYSILMTLTPLVSLAQTTGTTGGSDYTGTTGGSGLSLENPLGDVDLVGFLQSLLDVVMIFAIPLIVFMIIYAGFTYVMAQGKPADISKANRALLYALIGGTIIIGANAILAVVSGTVDAFRN